MACDRGPEYLAAAAVRAITMTIPITITAIAVSIAAVTFIWRVCQSERSERRRRRKLVNAVYHHVDRAVNSLEGQAEKNETIRQKINADESYTPYVARSSSDDLTYEQIIEVMEWLERRKRSQWRPISILSHRFTRLRRAWSWSSLEVGLRIGNWLWKTYEKYEENTLTYARATREVEEPGGNSSLESSGNEYLSLLKGWDRCPDRIHHRVLV